jgi:hypothetical protein
VVITGSEKGSGALTTGSGGATRARAQTGGSENCRGGFTGLAVGTPWSSSHCTSLDQESKPITLAPDPLLRVPRPGVKADPCQIGSRAARINESGAVPTPDGWIRARSRRNGSRTARRRRKQRRRPKQRDGGAGRLAGGGVVLRRVGEDLTLV